MSNSVKEFKASVWNDKMSKMKNLVKQLHVGMIRILCNDNDCNGVMHPQEHYDFDDMPHKKQYVCEQCNKSDYIVV